MKLSECWKGRVVQAAHLGYEGAIDMGLIGHVEAFRKEGGDIQVGITSVNNYGIWYAYPEDIKPLED